eukprot:scaffold667090_cov47-Prasinocladus_malaysianus.AAC.1
MPRPVAQFLPLCLFGLLSALAVGASGKSNKHDVAKASHSNLVPGSSHYDNANPTPLLFYSKGCSGSTATQFLARAILKAHGVDLWLNADFEDLQ